MDLIKKHYEKILLGVMLAGLIGLLVFMLFYIGSQTSEMARMREELVNPQVRALTNLDMTLEDGATARLKAPYNLDLETTNKLFNSLEWQRDLNGVLITGKKTGAQMATVTNITALYFIATLESVVTNEAATNYVIRVERQAAATSGKRQPARRYVSFNDLNHKPNDIFGLVGVKGSPENPDSLTLKLVDNQQEVTVSKSHPYERVDGYAVDFRYDPERKAFRGKRVGDRVSFGGADYTVVEINQNEMILMDQSNQKKTSLPFNP
jgi:hypothetical protein